MSDARSGAYRAPMPRLTRMSTRGGTVSLDVPAGWETIDLSDDGGIVAAVEPHEADRFRTNFVLTFTDVAGSLDDWHHATHDQDELELDGYLLLDHEELAVGDRVWVRRLTTHSTPARESVTTESWTTVDDGTGMTLTARVGTLRLADMAPVIDAVAASLVARSDGLVPA